MRESPSWFRVYLWSVTASGFVLLLYVVRSISLIEMLVGLTFAIGVGALESVRFILPRGEAISASSGLVLMILWVYGPGVAALADGLAVLVIGLSRRGIVANVLFNLGQLTVSIVAANVVFELLGGRSITDNLLMRLVALLASGVAFFVVNSMLLERALSLYKRAPFWPMWWESFRQFGMRFSPPLLFAIILVGGYPYMGSLFLLVIIILIACQYILLRRYAHRSQERAVTSLLELTAQRDAFRPGHSDRVLRYSSAIGRELGLSPSDMKILRYAALLHDVGIAMLPTDLLAKESALAAEERLQVEKHPAEGAKLLGQLAPLVPVAHLVRHHHEWYNGSGYPDRLQGDEIPRGARILAVGDAFDAMTTDQPHRRGLLPHAAMDELRRLVGVQFDGGVVSALQRALERDKSLVDFVSRRGREDVDDEITLTIRHLKDYVTGSESAADISRLATEDTQRDEGVLREIRRRAAGILALYDLGQVINSSLSLKEVLDLVARTAGRTVNARCAILLVEQGSDNLTFASTYGLITPAARLPRLKATEGPWGDALRNGRAVVLHGQGSGRWPQPLLALIAAEGLESFLFLPLIAKGKSIGLMFLCHGTIHRFNEQEQNLLSIIASQAALAIENAKLYSETKERLEQISSMKQFTDAILENVHTGIVVVDELGKVQLVNQVAKEIAARLEGEFPDRWEDCVLFRRLTNELPIDEVLRTGVPVHIDRWEVSRERVSVIIDAHASALAERRGRSTGVIIVFRDITERSRLEEEVRRAQQLAMVGEIAAGAAHEIRNPLTSVRGFIQVLQDRIDWRDLEREYMDIILTEIDRIDELLTELMLLARPPSLKLEPCCVISLLDEQCLLIKGDKSARGMEIVREYTGEIPKVLADKNQIRQVLRNLFMNSLQAMAESGEGTLTVSAGYFPERDEVEIRVQDTGPGIPPEDKERIFTPFFTTKERGTGLGLAVSFGIIRNHGGRIDVESAPGAGALFRVLLPVRSVEERSAGEEKDNR